MNMAEKVKKYNCDKCQLAQCINIGAVNYAPPCSKLVEEKLKSPNTTKATIALAETYRDNFLKRSSLYNMMSGFVEWLKEQQ